MCFHPRVIKPNYKEDSILNPVAVTVKCGRCLECRRDRSRQWMFRLEIEREESLTAHFVTLTYNDENIPYSENGLPTLYKKDVQDFMKRLRKRCPLKLKYYLCGEYGFYQRPHYHMIIFNVHDESLFDACWRNGFVYVSDVGAGSLAYVTGYVNKYMIKYAQHEDDDRLKEFNLISKGIGASFAERPDVAQYINSAVTDEWRTKQGERFTIPRYLKQKMTLCDSVKYEIYLKKKAYFDRFNIYDKKLLEKVRDERLRLIDKAKIVKRTKI